MTGEAGTAAAAIDAPTQGVGVGRVVLASLIGTAIEFYDFYIYGAAAAAAVSFASLLSVRQTRNAPQT